METTPTDKLQKVKGATQTRWWYWLFAFFGWNLGVGESGILARLKNEENLEVSDLDQSEQHQIRDLDKLIVNEKSLKAFSALLAFLGIVFLFGEGVIRFFALVCLVLSLPMILIGIRIGKKARLRYEQFITNKHKLPGSSGDTSQ